MITPELRVFIRKEIEKYANVILSGQTNNAQTHTEDINNLYPGMPIIQNRPKMEPYGFSSKATDGTIQVTARQGENFNNKMVLGHRDKNKPTDLATGESVHYSSGGSKAYARNDSYDIEAAVSNIKADLIKLGSEGASDPAVLFNELKTLLEQILDAIAQHTHGGMTIPPPDNAGDFTAFKADIDTIQSSKVTLE